MEAIIKEMIKEQLNIFGNVKGSQSLEKLGMDSLDRVELILLIEEEFLIDVDFGKAEKWNLVQDIINYIKEMKNEQ